MASVSTVLVLLIARKSSVPKTMRKYRFYTRNSLKFNWTHMIIIQHTNQIFKSYLKIDYCTSNVGKKLKINPIRLIAAELSLISISSVGTLSGL